jgi:hypothetical protein
LLVYFAFVLAAILILHTWLPGALSGRIEREIRNGLNPESVDLYEVEADTAGFSALFGTIRIPEIWISPKEDILNDKDSSLLPTQMFGAEVYNMKLSSWTLISLALGRKEIGVNRFSTDSIFFTIYTNEHGIEKTDSAQSTKMEQLNLKKISTHKLRIEQVSLADSSKQVLQTGNVDFSGTINFYGQDHDYFMKTGIHAHSLRIKDVYASSSNGLYNFEIDTVQFDGNGQTADLYGVKMIPIHSKQDFHKHVQFETDRFDVMLEHIRISGIQSEKAIQEGAIVLSQIEIKGGNLEAFRDRKPPFNEQQRPLMPVRLIQEAPFGLYAGKVICNEVDIVYAELAADSDEAGEVPFKQLSATISNITNLEDSLASDSSMNINAEALIFGNAKLQAEFKYTLTDPVGPYEVNGNLAKFKFVDINSAVYPLTGIKVNEGLHQNTSFYFYGNDVRSVGELRMQYSDLQIELLPDGGSLLQGLARFAGRTALYHEDNPSGEDEIRVGQIEFERDVSRFVFNYWWKSYLSGVKDSVLRDNFLL